MPGYNAMLDALGKNKQDSASLSTILAAFVPTFLTAALFIAIFSGIRHRYPKLYTPRAFIGTIPEKDRTPVSTHPSHGSYFDWVHTLWRIPDTFVLYHESLDAYLYLRFLRTLIFICGIGLCLTWPILLPVHATGGGKSTELDRLTIGNISNPERLYVHAAIAWIFFPFVMFTVARERLWLIGLRQAWSTSKANAQKLSSRTVLFLSAPKDVLNKDTIQQHFGDDAVRIWPATNAQKIEALVSDRNSKIEQLEAAEMSLIQTVNKKGRKGIISNYQSLPGIQKKAYRPTHRLKTKPVGRQVDTIDWLREKIKEAESNISKARQAHDDNEPHGPAAIFVEFRSLASAQAAYQQVHTAGLLTLTPRYTGIRPEEVIWSNLSLSSESRISKQGLAVALIVATIIFWFIPISFVGAISNVSYLADNYKWLSFLNKLPPVAMGLLSGLVPPLLTSMLVRYVPKIYRYIFRTLGEPTTTSAELKVQKWFYIFQVIHVFLVTAIASGSAAAVPQIARRATEDPASIPLILARNLPKSSNFYLTYFIVQGLTSSSDNLLIYSDLLSYLFFDYFFDKTPRQKFKSFTTLRGIQWGKVFPKYTNFVIIALAYSCLAPLILGFAALGLSMLYFSYRYMLLFTVSPKVDTKGHCYTLALQQLLTGIYIAELALLGIFSLQKATGPGIIVGFLFVATVLYHVVLNKYLAPLETYLPMSELEQEGEEEDDEQTHLLSNPRAEEAGHPGSTTRRHINSLTTRHPLIGSKVLDPMQRFFQPHIFASYKAMRAWLSKDFEFHDPDNVPRYTEEQLENAYVNPALTSKTPVVWLARDGMGVSREEVRECEGEGLRASDEGAWVDGKGVVRWRERDFGEVPIFKGEGVAW